MSLSVLNFNRIRDLVSNLGHRSKENSYIVSSDCLKNLEKLENELLKEDVDHRNVRISLHICAAVKKDLIPILIHGTDFKVLATVTRVLASLSLPVECLLPIDAASSPTVRKQLMLSTFAIKKAFLDATASSPVVTMLRETMLKSEKHGIPLKDEDYIHLKNCLILLHNLLYLPEDFGKMDENCIPKFSDWHSVQNKLIWNIFVQGIDGALILMLNSRHKDNWTVNLALIIGLLFRNQNISKVHRSIEMVSSASESSGEDEESDTSKYSSTSSSSEPSNNAESLSDSGCPPSCESSEMTCDENENSVKDCFDDYNSSPLNIEKKLEKIQISDDPEYKTLSKIKVNSKQFHKNSGNIFNFNESHPNADNDSESSSSSESPFHKKMRGNSPNDTGCESLNCFLKCDSAMSEGMDYNSPDNKSSDDDNFNEKRVVKNLKAAQKLKSEQLQSKFSESDSSNENFQKLKKHRNHPPTGRRGKSPRRKDGCVPSICIDSAYSSSCLKGRIVYPLWKKRNSVSTLTNNNSSFSPTDDDIGFLLKEFTLAFLHSGFSDLILNLKNMLVTGPHVGIDKSLLFWMLSYFLHLAASVNLSINHISNILNDDLVLFLIYESVNACENLTIHSNCENVQRYISVHLNLLVSALKEVLSTMDLYFRKSSLQKDKSSFNNIYGKLSESLDFRQIPLLLLHLFPKINSKQYLEDVIVLNHHIIMVIERGSPYAWEHKKVNMVDHLTQFSNKHIVDCYRKVLENFKQNSSFLNECVFTMWHHLAGDVHSCHLLFDPDVLKVFSKILEDDIELDQYQEDLIIYILNQFCRQEKKRRNKEKQSKLTDNKISDDSSSYSSVSSISSRCLLHEEDDDLFWWYLQFQQDKDPISRISEHVPTAKRDASSNKFKVSEMIMCCCDDYVAA